MEISKSLNRALDEFGIEKMWRQEAGLVASLQEVEKMDAILKMKVAEEKRAKLSRIQVEEESREILSKLPCLEMSNKIKLNLEEFMRLLDEAGKDEEILPLNELKEVDQEEKRDAEEEEGAKGKRNEQKRNTNELTFVEKNILLAKCGRGTLSLTTEEVSRIENLLADLDSKDSTLPEINCGPRREFFAVDDATRSILNQIDQQLEGLSKSRNIGEPEKNSIAPGKRETEEEEPADEEKQKVRKEKKKEKKGSRLEEINKLLNFMQSVSEEEIRPLSEEEMGNLLQESMESSKEEEKKEKDEKEESEKPPSDVVAQLVSSARLLMPKFQYRFQEP